MPTQPAKGLPLSRADVVKLVGELDDSVISAIIGTGATYLEIEAAVRWAAGDAEQLGKGGHALTIAAAAVHDILVTDPAFEPEMER